MKKTNTSNPLKFFNDAKAARNKSLVKAGNGRTMGPMTQQEAAAETAATSYPGPYANPKPIMMDIDPKEALKNSTQRVNNIEYEKGFNSNSGAMQARSAAYQKKGGSVKSKMKTEGTHKMPNGKIMLNSAMKKKTSKKK